MKALGHKAKETDQVSTAGSTGMSISANGRVKNAKAKA